MKAAIALFAGLLIGLGATYAADRTGVIDLSSDDTPTTTSSTSTTEPETTTTTEASPVDRAVALWPAPDSDERFDSPEEAARSFASDYVGMRAPVVGAFQAGDPSSGEVLVQAFAQGPVSRVLVRQLLPGNWWVTGAATETIRVDTPQPGERVSSPLRVAGAAQAFEGTVTIHVRADGATKPVGEGFGTGGGDQPLPFEGTVQFDEAAASPAGYGAVLIFEGSARSEEDGPNKFTIHRIRF